LLTVYETLKKEEKEVSSGPDPSIEQIATLESAVGRETDEIGK